MDAKIAQELALSPGLLWLLGIGIAAWSTVLLSVIKFFLANYFRGINEKFVALAETMSTQTDEVHRLDKEILKLRSEMHVDFVRREDSIRDQVVINAKLDALSSKIENLTLRSGTRGP